MRSQEVVLPHGEMGVLIETRYRNCKVRLESVILPSEDVVRDNSCFYIAISVAGKHGCLHTELGSHDYSFLCYPEKELFGKKNVWCICDKKEIAYDGILSPSRFNVDFYVKDGHDIKKVAIKNGWVVTLSLLFNN